MNQPFRHSALTTYDADFIEVRRDLPELELLFSEYLNRENSVVKF